MIKEVTIPIDVGDPRAAQLTALTYGVNACIRKINILTQMMDRKFATNLHTRELTKDEDPNVPG